MKGKVIRYRQNGQVKKRKQKVKYSRQNDLKRMVKYLPIVIGLRSIVNSIVIRRAHTHVIRTLSNVCFGTFALVVSFKFNTNILFSRSIEATVFVEFLETVFFCLRVETFIFTLCSRACTVRVPKRAWCLIGFHTFRACTTIVPLRA